MIKKRYGKIKISKEVFEFGKSGLFSFLEGMKIYKCEFEYVTNCFVYDCEHPAFDEIEEGEEIPNYIMEFKKKNDFYFLKSIERIK